MTTLTPAIPRNPDRIIGRDTRYEICIDGVPVSYKARRTQQALLSIIHCYCDYIVERTGEAPAVNYNKSTGFSIVGHLGVVSVAFTGRTERQAANFPTGAK